MTTARGQLVDVSVTRYYHCISRCARQAMLCGEGFEHRKQWIEDRLELLAGCFSISVCSYSVMENHFHVTVRLDPEVTTSWSEAEVVRRWLIVYPPKTPKGDKIEVTHEVIEERVKDAKNVAKWRERLASLSWFMKALKEPFARMANREDNCRGVFWESRFKSIAILDTEALLATCAYIDLNLVAAGAATTPETSPHTSIRRRVHHARAKGMLDTLKAAARGSVAGSLAAGDIEQDLWLCPLENRQRLGSPREGMLESFSLGSYLLLIDHTSRLYRQGKARVSDAVASILDRLGTNNDLWSHRIRQLFSKPRLMGSYYTTDRAKLRALAQRLGKHHLDNVA